MVQGDCLDVMRGMNEQSVDLVFGSPPYVDARTYSRDDIQRGCEEWVEWMLDVSEAALRVSKGLVLWVVAGVQRDGCYWPGPEGLVWEWWRRGGGLWCPCVWWKVNNDEGGTGIPGSGGKQALRKDWEYVLMFKRRDQKELPWADSTAMGHPPVYSRVGGAMSQRSADGRRANDPWGTASRGGMGCGGRKKDGTKMRGTGRPDMDAPAGHNADGTIADHVRRPFPSIANPGNVIPCAEDGPASGMIVKARVGGGHLGSRLAHDNEAPFPEALASFFVRSYCPPGGVVLDPYCGSGTTLAMCLAWGRRGIGIDVRQRQVDLTTRRCQGETPALFPE